jgi:hypothetical protein
MEASQSSVKGVAFYTRVYHATGTIGRRAEGRAMGARAVNKTNKAVIDVE